jgi:hypothetical protein
MSEQGTLTGKFEGVDITFIYTGGVLNGQMHGKGKSTWSDGTVLEGDWVDGKLNGNGKQTSPDGSVYEGGFVDGLSSGKGKMTYPSGGVYEGDYVEGMRTGTGKLTNAAGGVYEGGFVNGKFHGKGKITNADGSVFEGDFVDGKPVSDSEKNMSSKDIFYAATIGTVEDIRYFIEEKGVYVNARDNSGWTPLHVAAKYGNIEAVKFLVSKGADIHVTDRQGFTPLHQVAFHGRINVAERIETAKFLISNGANVNAKTYEGNTPVDLAKDMGFTEFLSLASRRRHGIILSIGGGVYTVSFLVMMDRMLSKGGLWGLMPLALFVPASLLGKGKKIGFWMLCGVSVIAFVLNIVLIGFKPLNLIGLLGIPIMWGVLHIRKDGKSVWEQLK